MYLKHRNTGRLVEVLGLGDLYNPMHTALIGRYHYGEEVQEPERFDKNDLVFCSGEDLPRCWIDVHYRDEEARHHHG
ncbi:acetyltransferase [Thiohalocapsa marina]|uniref:Acetyltransferase n=1 Tax=Thiohalocapsa marina TaxID=424902 RepID=A0A5M8FPL7_9GAMM|nr:acetyltransferase [Thiohalocapsa marina]KAA6186719.1 acetyltransferase [Thiohalocapsa marina]